MNISLISEHKIPFIIHRIFQTFLGGLELSTPKDSLVPVAKNGSIGSSSSSISNSLVIKLLIYLFPSFIGIIASILIDHHLVDSYIGVLSCSIIGLFFTLIMNVNLQISNLGSINKTSPLVWSPNTMIPSCSKEQHTKYYPLVIKYHLTVLILIRSLVSSSLFGMMTNTFKLKQIKAHIQTGNFMTLCIFFLVWFTFTTVQYPLIIGSPPETTAYSIRFNEINCFNRSIYLLLLLILITFMPTNTYVTCTSIICCLPFMWLLGILPPVTALSYYLLERINIILLAGTSSCYIWSLFMAVTFSMVTILINYFYLDRNYFFLVNLMAGFLASNKWLFNLNQLYQWTYLLKMIVSMALIIAINLINKQIDLESIQHELFKSLSVILSMIYAVKYFKMIYVFNIAKNPFNMIMSNKFLERIHSNRIFILIIRILLHLCLPVICLTLVVNKLTAKKIHTRANNQFVPDFFLNVLVFRIFRHCWQYPHMMGFQTILIQTIEHQKSSHFASEWPLEVKYFGLDLIFIFVTDFFKKLYLVLTILTTSVVIRKQKVRYSWTIFVLNIILLPVNFSIIIISSVLNAPILPLFTLPIFLLSFPRPLKFWSTTPIMIPMMTDMNDATYYKQVMPRLIDSLHRKSLFWDFRRAGEIMIARFDDRLMWFQVLESGHNYCQVQMKGLELQETSCHTLEASTIDQIIERSFHSLGIWCDDFFNKYILYAINPMLKTSTRTYSDAKSVLTGIIDSPETYIQIQRFFCQVFIWVLLHKKIQTIMERRKENHNKSDASTVTIKESQINIVVHSESTTKQEVNISSSVSSLTSPLTSSNNANQFNYDDLQPDLQWSNVSYQYSVKKSINHKVNCFMYSIEWFQKVLKVLTKNQEKLNENELKSLTIIYNHITNACYSIMFPVAYIETSTAQSIYELFNDQITKDASEENVLCLNSDLYQVCIKSFQYTTKIAFDQVIFKEENFCDDELISKLKDFDQNWLFGASNSSEWKQAVLNEKTHLFAISKDVVKENYQSHLLTLKDTDVFVCSLNRPIIEAIWSSLSFELFYLTNDDEERYSIQAHQIIFRNLTVQAADPPLGYPVYASEPILITHIT